MERYLSSSRRVVVLLCIGIFIVACGQARPDSATVASTAAPTQQNTATPQATPTDEPTAAATDTPAAQSQVQRTANMREGPSTSYAVIRTVDAKTTVTLIAVRDEQGQRWYRVQIGGVEGWMSSTVLSVDDAVAANVRVDVQSLAPLPTETPKPAAVIKPTPKPAAVIKPTAKPAPAIVAPSGGRVGAICRDGSHSNATGSGACSHHGGVDHWLYQ